LKPIINIKVSSPVRYGGLGTLNVEVRFVCTILGFVWMMM